MSVSVKVSEQAKYQLEELQAEIKRETGQEVTRKEIVDRIIERVYDSRAEFIELFRDEFDGLSEEEIDVWLSGTTPSGDPVDEDDIDLTLY